MNCSKCGKEMMVSHIEKNGDEEVKPIYVCLNPKCSAYSHSSKIKPKKS